MGAIADFFDARAERWINIEAPAESAALGATALLAGVSEGSRVLDLGTGLGVMMPAYLQAKVAEVVAVDLSGEMIRHASQRWSDYPELQFVQGDGSTFQWPSSFDAIVMFNCYPHFMDRISLVNNCHGLLAEGGRFVVAHSPGRDAINSHHEAQAAGVSLGLSSPADEAAIWSPAFSIDVLTDTPSFYAFAGQKL